MKTTLASLLPAATLAVVGCNAILANDPGVLAIPDESPAEPAPEAGQDGGADAASPDGAVATSEAGDACPVGQHRCNGLCVSAMDPLFGCGSPSCMPCTIAHGTAACGGGKCIVGSCMKGYADCDGKPESGCELDLSKATSCGACNAVCPAAAPFCAPGGGSFECTTGCTPAAPLLCGDQCVDPTTNVTHCGSCNTICPDVADATIACVASACTFRCNGLMRACNGKCVTRTDPTACGDACVVCPVPPGARATCENDACGSKCKENFGDCNLDPADGCEVNLANDPANCGRCGNACPAGSTCKGKACRPPVLPPPRE